MKNRMTLSFTTALLIGAVLSGLTGCQTAPTEAGPAPAPFTSAQTQEMDKTIADLLKEHDLPGAMVLVRIPGKGEYFSAQGTANLATGEPPARDNTVRIGSVTKTFTATAILQLVDKKKLSLTDPLSTWYPDFPNAAQITVNDLLRMRSGIPEYWDGAAVQDYFDHPLETLTAEQIIASTASRATEFIPPGGKTDYNNVNFSLLQRIVEKVTGRTLGETITEEILEPAGLRHTSYPVTSALPGPQHSYGWDDATSALKDITELNPAPAGGAGAMLSTVDDLAAWSRLLYTGENLLSSETQKTRLDLDGSAYYGAGIATVDGLWGHNGTIAGFSTEMWYFPEHNAEVVISVNRADAPLESESTVILGAVASRLLQLSPGTGSATSSPGTGSATSSPGTGSATSSPAK